MLAAATVALVAPVLTACGDDDESPVDPTVSLFEETINPNVSTDVTT